MKVSRIFVALLVMFVFLRTPAPVRAEINFVKEFLSRYRPSKTGLPAAATAPSSQDLSSLIRADQLPLSIGDLINLILQNNLDVGVNRLSPLSSLYLIETLYRSFEPTLHLQATVNRNTSPSTSILAGAANPSTLGGAYTVGFSQFLETGTIVGVDANVNRSSTNSNFSTLNPTWNSSLRYSFTQHLARDYGRLTNMHQIRV